MPAPSTGKRKRTTLPSLSSSKANRAQAAAQKKPTTSKHRNSMNDDGDDNDGESKASKFGFKKKAPKPYARGPRSTRPRNPRKASDDEESEGSGYEEVGGGGYSDDDDDEFGGAGSSSDDDGGMDITAALSGSMPGSSKGGLKASASRAKQPSQDAAFHAAGGKKKGSQYVPGQDDEDDEDAGSDGDAIVEMMEKRNVKDAKAVVKSVVSKKGDNGKNVKEATGGGSFQSMGQCNILFDLLRWYRRDSRTICVVSHGASQRLELELTFRFPRSPPASGLLPSLLKSIMKKYKTPTPIQRLSIPAALSSPPRDIVAMSRTGSGKTLAYVAPLIQRLHGRHSSTFGARAIVLCPGRELAVQILKVGKEMARGFKSGGGADHAGDDAEDGDANGKRNGDELRWGLVVGGEGLDEQFEMISSNPDV